MNERGDARWIALLAGACMTTLSLLWSWGPSYWFVESASLSAVRRPEGALWALVHHIDAVALDCSCIWC